MKKILVFEHTEYNALLEKEFYRYCVIRQYSLIRYLIAYFLYSFLYFLKIISEKKYFEKRWSFLKNVNNLEDKINCSWKSKKKKLAHFVLDREVVWVSEYPEILLRDLSQQCGTGLVANVYDSRICIGINLDKLF